MTCTETTIARMIAATALLVVAACSDGRARVEAPMPQGKAEVQRVYSYIPMLCVHLTDTDSSLHKTAFLHLKSEIEHRLRRSGVQDNFSTRDNLHRLSYAVGHYSASCEVWVEKGGSGYIDHEDAHVLREMNVPYARIVTMPMAELKAEIARLSKIAEQEAAQ